jgi:3-deoxy-D-manno-octulosonic-acid transferase
MTPRPPAPPRSAALALYLGLSRLAAPAARALLRRRLARGKEDPARVAERTGVPSAPRPPGPLVWLHGASVGEGLAALDLARRLAATRPGLGLLLTTGTVTSAKLLAGRLPPGAAHQYAPLDALPFLDRFLDHWRPDVAARVDSELWPATIWATARSGARLALVNARVSEGAARGWSRVPGLSAALLGRFDAVLAQDAAAAARLRAIGVDPARLSVGGALKGGAPPPDADPAALAALRAATAGRPVWLAASTHAPEEALALSAHAAAAPALPGLLTVIAPRHPDRGPAVAAQAQAAGLSVTRRGAGEGPGAAAVYVADTLGEMGLWYRLAPFAFVGGTVAPMGGHNPYEPAALGVALAHGPSVHAFADAYAALGGAAFPAADAPALADALRACLAPGGGPTPEGAARAAAARAALAPDERPAERATAALLALLPGGAP